METINVFRLKKDFKGFKANTLILKGSDLDFDTNEEEFFDIDTEIETGDCYSVYGIPADLLKQGTDEDIKIVEAFFEKDRNKLL